MLYSHTTQYTSITQMHTTYTHICTPQTSPDYDHLMLMHKVEVFEQAIESTSGDDLAKVLWLKSPTSEVFVSVCLFV